MLLTRRRESIPARLALQVHTLTWPLLCPPHVPLCPLQQTPILHFPLFISSRDLLVAVSAGGKLPQRAGVLPTTWPCCPSSQRFSTLERICRPPDTTYSTSSPQRGTLSPLGTIGWTQHVWPLQNRSLPAWRNKALLGAQIPTGHHHCIWCASLMARGAAAATSSQPTWVYCCQ